MEKVFKGKAIYNPSGIDKLLIFYCPLSIISCI